MKHTKKEILDALKVIKDVCADTESCSRCPFGKDNTISSCRITRVVPADWDIDDEEQETWKAFK